MATIVCIEDDEDYRETLAYELENAGHTVIESDSGNEGLGLIYEHKPDLVVSDVMMPNMTGLELLIKLRSCDEGVVKTPVILISASTHKHYQDEALKYGASEFLLKPINWDSFIGSVKQIISNNAV